MAVTEPDAIIIGAGHNSLACAVHLISKGWNVLILEKAKTAGGAIKSGEFTEPGFMHDWAAMNLSLFAGSPFFKQYGDQLVENGLSFVPVESCFASVFPNGKWLGISNNFDHNFSQLSKFSKNDADTWKKLTENFPEESSHIFKLLGNSLSFRNISSLFLNLYRKKGFSGALDFIRFLMASPRNWLDENFESEEVRATMAAWGMHLDFAPDTAGGALFPYLESMANQSFGMVLGQGGADTIIKAMVKYINSNGGMIEYNSEVTEIIHDGVRAESVKLSDGRLVHAKRCVIANVAPSSLLKLTNGFKKFDYSNGLKMFKHAPGTMMIHLSMDDLPNWLANEKLKEFSYIHIAPSLDQMAKTYQQATEGLLPDFPVIVIGQPTTVDPSRAPAGKHILWIQVRMVPGIIKGDGANKIKDTEWESAKEFYADRVLDIIEDFAPKTKEKVISRRIVSPIELQNDNPNLVFGDQICGSHHLTQHFIYRPLRGYTDGKTPIRNLHLTGAAVWPGAGAGAGSGFLLGRKLAGN
jgi:phytoene dehydrogenase-like protein